MLFTPLWFWGLRREIEAFAIGTTVTGGALNYPAFRITLTSGTESRDLVVWLDPAYARAEWSAPRDSGDLPAAWGSLQGAICRSVEQPYADRRLRLAFDSPAGSRILDFFAFGRSGLALSGPDPTQAPIVFAGFLPKHIDPPEQPLVADLLPDTPVPSEPCADLSSWLNDHVRGLDPLWTEAACRAAGVDPDQPDPVDDVVQAVWQFVCEQGHRLATRSLRAFTVLEADALVRTALVDFSTYLPGRVFQPADSLSAASGRVVHHLRRSATKADDTERLLTTARGKLRRIKRRMAALEEDARQQQEHARWQENADWLTAHLGQITQGTAELDVPEGEGVRRVPLDPAIAPKRQADRWYRKARRLRRGLETTREQIEATQAERDALETAIVAVRDALASGAEQASDVWAQLRALTADMGVGARGRKDAPRLPFRRFRSPGGLAIWVGRNNKENDELTLHHAHKKDLWFHAQQTPGSHVVLRSHALKQTPAKGDILAAAAVAAFFSKARHSSKVPVIYTEARYVRKPRKAPPGQVLVEREKSVMVSPEKLPEWNETDPS